MATAIVSEVEYRELPEFPGYRIGSDGSVWSRWKNRGKAGRQLVCEWRRCRQTPGKKGYLRVSVCPAFGRPKTVFVHKLVLLAFTGPKPTENHQCRHRNGITSDNRATNVRWGTAQENIDDRERHGTTQKGERHYLARLTEETAAKLRQMYRDGLGDTYTLARHFGIAQGTAWACIAGKTWKHIA